MSDDERAIRAVVDQWMAASKAGDTASVLNLMCDDALFLTMGREPFGKREFLDASEALKHISIDGQASIEEMEVIGDRAWVRNHIELTITHPENAPVYRSGETLTIFRKGQDGRWRLFRDANLVS
ncbi:MAG TPA: SgcJ/EcaC family oxidoreductase [Sphingomicrobium sp.]|nr:SgcJ/EcaC family oxidoreductase [Sphingomicrobium sp.]